MQYLLNGGGHELRALGSPELVSWMKEEGVERLLFVAFAMAEEFWQKTWETPERHFQLDGIAIESLTMTNYDSAKAIIALESADAVFMPGGVPDILMQRLKQTGFDTLLKQAVAADKLIFVGGGSAGEMALGSHLVVGGKPGLDIVPNHIFDAHFSTRKRLTRLQEAVDRTATTIGVGIDEDTTLILNKDYQPTRIFGDGTVTYYKHEQEPQTYDSNSTL